MEYGYKARSLFNLERRCLPTLAWAAFKDATSAAIRACEYHMAFNGKWAVRTDLPENTGAILPLYGSNRNTPLHELPLLLEQAKDKYPECSFVVSETTNDKTRDSNIVCWMDAGMLYGEISFDPMTLRDAWVKGKPLTFFNIDGGIGDYLRNYHLRRKSGLAMIKRLDYLRRIRHFVEPFPGEEFEISVTETGRIIFWQSLIIKEPRCSLTFKHY